jgi:hypothetical protein
MEEVSVGVFGHENRSRPSTAQPSDGGGACSVARRCTTRAPAASDGDRLGSVAACTSIRFPRHTFS